MQTPVLPPAADGPTAPPREGPAPVPLLLHWTAAPDLYLRHHYRFGLCGFCSETDLLWARRFLREVEDAAPTDAERARLRCHVHLQDPTTECVRNNSDDDEDGDAA